jgi:hypothetical protein
LVGPWETFSLIMLDKTECGIQSHRNLFLSADLGGHSEITAAKTKIDLWETFTIIKLDSDLVAFKASNGKYWSVDKTSNLLYANGDSIGIQEQFHLKIRD